MKVCFTLTDTQSAFIRQQAERRGLTPAAFAKESVIEKATRYIKGEQPWEEPLYAEISAPLRRRTAKGLQGRPRRAKRCQASVLRGRAKIQRREQKQNG